MPANTWQGKAVHFINLPDDGTLPLAAACRHAEILLQANPVSTVQESNIVVRSDYQVGHKGKITISVAAFQEAVKAAAASSSAAAEAWWKSLKETEKSAVFSSSRDCFSSAAAVVPAGKRGRSSSSADEDDDDGDDDDGDSDDGNLKAARSEGLEGKTLCFTGTLSVKRSDAEAKAKKAGASVASTLTAAVTHVVVGENAGKKLEEAKKKGKTVLTEAEFNDLLAGKAAPSKKGKGGILDVDWATEQSSGLPLPAPTDAVVKEVEKKLGGVTLPASYVALCRQRNGGDLGNRCYSGDGDMTCLYGIGVDPGIVADQENWTDEWEYPVKRNGHHYVYIGETSSGGHDMVAFEYDDKDLTAEPRVVNVDQEIGPWRVKKLADNFSEFMSGLTTNPFDCDDEDDE